ncbi:hypothetical protein PIB30_102070 [Stylosanthes scabra]|uniref:Uncharacterized protein n=1 Tax=Stylosanthes scabra TaxID=79078 RepID=A0ABU6YY97_9FABA|nr:hypothetical protein [Stylosanthes scabra]
MGEHSELGGVDWIWPGCTRECFESWMALRLEKYVMRSSSICFFAVIWVVGNIPNEKVFKNKLMATTNEALNRIGNAHNLWLQDWKDRSQPKRRLAPMLERGPGITTFFATKVWGQNQISHKPFFFVKIAMKSSVLLDLDLSFCGRGTLLKVVASRLKKKKDPAALSKSIATSERHSPLYASEGEN